MRNFLATIASREVRHLTVAIFVFLLVTSLSAQVIPTSDPPQYGPFNGTFLADGEGLTKEIGEKDTVLRADLPWSLYAWVQSSETTKQLTLIGGVGDPNEQYPRYLAADRGRILLWVGGDNEVSAAKELTQSKWHLLAATFDGSDFRLYADGVEVGSGKL